MLLVVTTMDVIDAKRDDFETIARRLEQEVKRSEPECLLFRMSRNTEEPGRYTNVELFSDKAALDVHISSPHLAAAMGGMMECLLGEPSINICETIS